MATKSKVRRQWTYDSISMAVQNVTPQGYQILADPAGDLIAGKVRLVRMIGTVRLIAEDLVTSGSFGTVCVGLRPLPNGAPIGDFMQLNTNADRYYLMRQLYRLPEYSLPTTGMIDLNGEPYQFDWQIHGGRGANLTRDASFIVQADAKITSGTVRVEVCAFELWEAT